MLPRAGGVGAAPPVARDGARPSLGGLGRWAALVGLWTLPPLLAVLALSLRVGGGGPPVPWGRFFANQLLLWYPWVPLTPLVVRLADRCPPFGRRWPRNLAVHLAASVGVGAAFGAWLIGTELLAGLDLAQLPRAAVAGALASAGVTQALVYWLLLGGLQLLRFYRRSREREAQLARARLQALKAQIHPHFLFNTLHAATSLMADDVAGARRMIARLGELLRASLDGGAADEVPLREELELVDLYLDIERVRFGDRLRLRRSVPPETRPALVPHLALQPLVENAVRHGLGGSSSAGRVEIGARRLGDRLEVTITDDGPGLAEPVRGVPGGTEGVGLANVRARLAALYGDEASLRLENRPEGGCRARMEVPWRTAPS